MADHRIRFTDEDIVLVVAALKARRAMMRGLREHRIDRLIARLAEGQRGNPKFSLGEYEQTHEELLDDDECE